MQKERKKIGNVKKCEAKDAIQKKLLRDDTMYTILDVALMQKVRKSHIMQENARDILMECGGMQNNARVF